MDYPTGFKDWWAEYSDHELATFWGIPPPIQSQAIARIGKHIMTYKEAPGDANDIIDLIMTRANALHFAQEVDLLFPVRNRPQKRDTEMSPSDLAHGCSHETSCSVPLMGGPLGLL